VQKNLISPSNPQGVPTLGGTTYLQSFEINRGIYGVNYTQWFGDKFDTLFGFRYSNAYYYLANQSPPPQKSDSNAFDFNAGLDFKLTSWLRPYISASNTYNLPGTLITFTASPYGIPQPITHSLGEEAGLKFAPEGGWLSGSVDVYHVQSQNAQYILSGTLLTYINPKGLNGQFGSSGFGGAGASIAINEDSEGLEAALTASPTPYWRMRFSLGYTKGKVGNTTSYGVLYNDQFHENAAGQVTYADGALVYVNGAATGAATAVEVASTAAGATPLTVAAMSTGTSVYYANPAIISGAISSTSNVGKILLNPLYQAANGPVLTGQLGLPVSQIQINPGFTPTQTVVTSIDGDSTTGYPEWAVNYTTVFTVPSGWAKGIQIGGTAALAWERYDYYYYATTYVPGEPNIQFNWPDLVRFDGILGYRRKFGRITFSTQVNITNMFNRYKIVLLPNEITGYNNLNDVTFDQQPRVYQWTNTIRF